jgi:hypothetical protein
MNDMATTVTRKAFGQLIPVARMTPMARGIVARTSGNAAVRWSGFAWHQPIVERSDHLDEVLKERKAA